MSKNKSIFRNISRELINQLTRQLSGGTGPTEITGEILRHVGRGGESGPIDDYSRYFQHLNLSRTPEQEAIRREAGYPEGDYGFARGISASNRGMEGETFNDVFSTIFRDKEGFLSSMFPEVKVTPKAHDSIDKEMAYNDLVALAKKFKSYK